MITVLYRLFERESGAEGANKGWQVISGNRLMTSPSRIRTYDLAVNSGETKQAIKRRNSRPDNNLATIRRLRKSTHLIAFVRICRWSDPIPFGTAIALGGGSD